MLTDEQLIQRLRSSLRSETSDLEPPADLLAQVRRGHAARRRWRLAPSLGGVMTALAAGSGIAVAVLAIVLLGHQRSTSTGSGASAAGPVPRILLGRNGGKELTVYRPRDFYPPAHYRVTRAHWIKWNRHEAVARAVLTVQFPGAPARVRRTTITYSKPRKACGVYTYTVFASTSGAKAELSVEGGRGLASCLFQ